MTASLTTHDPTAYISHNPATGHLVRAYEVHDSQELDRRLQVACDAWGRLRKLPLSGRAGLLDRLATHFETNTEAYAALITREMGKAIGEAIKEVEKCATTCRIFSEAGPAWLAPDPLASGASTSYVSYESVGPVLAIMPWNFPFFQVMRFVTASIVAGNPTVLKHAENVPGCAEALEAAVAEACSWEGLLVNIRVPRQEVPSLVADPRIRAVTFTGSVAAGHSVAGLAGGAGKKVALELGGSDPFIVLEDANLDKVIPAAVEARFANAGQSCVCSKRFVVARPLAEDFLRGFARAASQLVVGDPADPATNLGPLARADKVWTPPAGCCKCGHGRHSGAGWRPWSRSGPLLPPCHPGRRTPRQSGCDRGDVWAGGQCLRCRRRRGGYKDCQSDPLWAGLLGVD